MRISDWSSDVCSSDLLIPQSRPPHGGCPGHYAGRSITMTAPSPCRSGKPSCLDDPVVTRVRSRGVVRCPIRFLGPLTGATPGGLAAIHRATLLALPGMGCTPRSSSPTSDPLETGMQTIQSYHEKT